jgi:Ran GTPase-activating protein (RanGAP) involved in mRNA processing and transport
LTYEDRASSPDFIRPIAHALKTNKSLTELNISGNHLNGEAVNILCHAIQENGVLSNLHVGQNNIPNEQMKAIIEMDKFDVLCAVPVKELKADSITELDLSEQSLGTEGVLVLSTHLQGNRALTSVNLLNNDIQLAQVQELVKIREESNNLKTLCGLTMEETELDVSNRNLKAGDAVFLASEIQVHRALTSLDISGGCLTQGKQSAGRSCYGVRMFCEVLQK